MRIDKRKMIMSVVVVILGLGVYGIRLLYETRSGVSIRISESDTPSSTSSESPSSTIDEETGQSGYETEESEYSFPVYICGAVNHPGVYRVSGEKFLYELIDLAGGLASDADKENIDMVYLIDHAQSLYIPIMAPSDETRHWNDFTEVRASSWEEGGTPPQSGLININSCGKEELCTLPGIGEKTAEKIVNYRQEHGLFAKKEDLCQVPGIGSSKYAAIEAYICV